MHHPNYNQQSLVQPSYDFTMGQMYAAQAHSGNALKMLSLVAIDVLWGLDTDTTAHGKSCSLKEFLEEVTRRYEQQPQVIHLAICYCRRINEIIRVARERYRQGNTSLPAILCCRRMFLSAVIVASKFHLDKGLSNKDWSDITRVGVTDITRSETLFLLSIGYRLFINQSEINSTIASLIKNRWDPKKDIQLPRLNKLKLKKLRKPKRSS